MKLLKFILKNYFQALCVLLITFGVVFWLRPARSLEIIEILEPLTFMARLGLLLLLNFSWCIAFILFDLWNIYGHSWVDENIEEEM